MVAPETEMINSQGKVGSPLQADQQAKNGAGGSGEAHPFSSLGRQSSIYSLTLDEFQHTLCESGKNFGSMNMDEFLTSIWNAEENQQATMNSNSQVAAAGGANYNATGAQSNVGMVAASSAEASNSKGGLAKQSSMQRQGSLTIPAPLCRKTVDEVWSEIHHGQDGINGGGSNCGNGKNAHNDRNAPRQPTFGEMTLEDFLVKAGVVREQHGLAPPAAATAQQQHFGVYQSTNNPNVGPGFVPRPVVPAGNIMPPAGGVMGDTSGYANGNKRNAGYSTPQSLAACYGGRVRNGGAAAYGPVQPIGVAGPLSPVSSEGIGHGQVDNMGPQYGMDMNALGGRKRIIDGPAEKVVERRQRRMIKNRESAARSRARKQAYTVELEAELNQLKEENAQLKQALAELERKRKQKCSEEPKMKGHIKGQQPTEMRRNLSCPM